MRLLLIEPQPILCLGVSEFLEKTEFNITHYAHTRKAAEEIIGAETFDMIVSEVKLADANGIHFLRQNRHKLGNTAVVFLTYFKNQANLAHAYHAGASGLLDKSIERDALCESLREVANGGTIWPPNMVKRVTSVLNSIGELIHEESLTRRELDVLRLVSDGNTNSEIAKQLDISYETVKEHVQHILKKLSLNDRTQASLWAVRNRIF